MRKLYTRKLHLPKEVREFIASSDVITTKRLSRHFGFSEITAMNYLSRAKKLELGTRVAPKMLLRAKHEYPEFSKAKKRVYDAIRKDMPFTPITIWSTFDLNKYAHNIIMKGVIFVETEGFAVEAVKDELLSNGVKAISAKSKADFENIFDLMETPVLVMGRKDKAGTNADRKDKYLSLPSFERIFIDVYFLNTRKNLSLPLSELGNILENISAFGYSLNYSLLNWVAMRRNVQAEIETALYLFKKKSSRFASIPEKFARKRQISKKRLNSVMQMVG
ncbi:hypothetical protein HY989_04470 [Candidatus Micrarchaeota archaeon]|nr:hypothetical protein [Candidatus Micrarchaeota archaeon]